MNQDCNPDYLQTLNAVLSGISLIASLIMTILCIRKLKSGRKFIQLVLGIACSDLVYAFSNLLSFVNQNQVVCYVEAITREWSFNFSLLFVVAIAVLCWRSSLDENPKQVEYIKTVLIIGTVTYVVLTCPLLWMKDYVIVTDNGMWCLITYNPDNTDLEKILVRIVYGGIPDFTYTVISVYCYIKIVRYLRERLGVESVQNFQLLGYTLVMCLIVFPAMFDNFFRIFYTKCELSWLIVLRVILTHSAGTLNAIVYGRQQQIWRNQQQQQDDYDLLD